MTRLENGVSAGNEKVRHSLRKSLPPRCLSYLAGTICFHWVINLGETVGGRVCFEAKRCDGALNLRANPRNALRLSTYRCNCEKIPASKC